LSSLTSASRPWLESQLHFGDINRLRTLLPNPSPNCTVFVTAPVLGMNFFQALFGTSTSMMFGWNDFSSTRFYKLNFKPAFLYCDDIGSFKRSLLLIASVICVLLIVCVGFWN
jgi:hypothetical protein